MVVVKAYTGHIVLNERYTFKSLQEVYPDIHRKVIEAGAPTATQEDPAVGELILDENIRAIKADKKPSGINRYDLGGVRLIFPIREDGQVEFYVSKHARCPEIVGLTESISSMLKKAGLKHSTAYDRSPMLNSRSAFQSPVPPTP